MPIFDWFWLIIFFISGTRKKRDKFESYHTYTDNCASRKITLIQCEIRVKRALTRVSPELFTWIAREGDFTWILGENRVNFCMNFTWSYFTWNSNEKFHVNFTSHKFNVVFGWNCTRKPRETPHVNCTWGTIGFASSITIVI